MKKKKPNIEEQRKFIMERYPGLRWHERVSNMKPAQIIAIYSALKARKVPKVTVVSKEEPYHQIDIFEYMIMKGKNEYGREEGSEENDI